MNHTCTNCKGLGHRKTVCTPPNPGNQKVEAEKQNLFLPTAPDSIHRLNVRTFETKHDDKSLMIDSGAAVSVAPLKEFTIVELNKKDKSSYNLQSAKGGRLNIYGTRTVPFKFESYTIYI